MPELTEALRQLLAEATPLYRGVTHNDSNTDDVHLSHVFELERPGYRVAKFGGPNHRRDSELYVAAVNALPQLLSALEASDERLRLNNEARDALLTLAQSDLAAAVAKAEAAEQRAERTEQALHTALCQLEGCRMDKDSAEQRAIRAEAGAAAMRDVLEQAAWVSEDGGTMYCQYCYVLMDTKHKPDCPIGNALADPTGAEALAEVTRLRAVETAVKDIVCGEDCAKCSSDGSDEFVCKHTTAGAALDAPATEASQ